MVIKLVRSGGETELIPCDHITTRPLKEGFPERFDGARIGTGILLSPSGRDINLPRDGHEAWVMNDLGKTVDHYEWPLRNGSHR